MLLAAMTDGAPTSLRAIGPISLDEDAHVANYVKSIISMDAGARYPKSLISPEAELIETQTMGFTFNNTRHRAAYAVYYIRHLRLFVAIEAFDELRGESAARSAVASAGCTEEFREYILANAICYPDRDLAICTSSSRLRDAYRMLHEHFTQGSGAPGGPDRLAAMP